MCQLCVDAVKRWYPELPEKDWSNLLFGATSFPFGDPEMVETQLKELREKTDGTLHEALKFADDELCAEMDRYKDRRIKLLSYKKWEKAGRPCSDGVSFWLEAEKDYYKHAEDDED